MMSVEVRAGGAGAGVGTSIGVGSQFCGFLMWAGGVGESWCRCGDIRSLGPLAIVSEEVWVKNCRRGCCSVLAG